MTRRFFSIVFLCGLLSACASVHLSDDAAEAKVHMIGMTREEVLECMGPAKKKAAEGTTEVWSYLSPDGSGGNDSTTVPIGSIKHTSSQHSREFCNVNIIMRDGVVTRVNYNGPSDGGIFAPNKKCGYAVANCVDENRF